MLAVATTSFLLLLLGDEVGAESSDSPPASKALAAESIAEEATKEATSAFQAIWQGGLELIPKLLVVVAIIVAGWAASRMLRLFFRRIIGRWSRGYAAAALASCAVWLLVFGASMGVLVGDIRALVGSLGLAGLALSWALQNPIEGATGWLLNSFQGYYRIGDRIAVGDVFGDVVDIDFLTTTVWEIGGADHRSSGIHAEQPTGRKITFPNNEMLTGSIINYTSDFPFVWDELAISIATESDVRYAARVAQKVASDLLDEMMRPAALRYRAILEDSKLPVDVPLQPVVYFSLTESGIDVIVRYLVGARERRKWKSELTLNVVTTFNQPEHSGKILPVYPRRQVQLVGADGRPRVPESSSVE